MISYKLYAITDRAWLQEGETLASAVEDAILGGATIVQLREKDKASAELKRLALSVMDVCKSYNVPLIINDNVDLAKEIDASGVHLGANDMSVKGAREILGGDKIIGRTAKSVSQAISAEKDGANYIGSGAIYPTGTKADASALSIDTFRDICRGVSIPVVAIGGINSLNVSSLKDTPLAGVAVVSGIFSHTNKSKASRDILSGLYYRPVVQCITNHVTVGEVANIVLTFGASPIMSHNDNEAYEVQYSADALLINLGATDDYDAIKTSYRTAIKTGHPIVIDPVGVSGISYRRNFLKELLDIGSPTCIRGNASEILAIYKDCNTAVGLDGDVEGSDMRAVTLNLARRLDTTIVASGVVDIISDGESVNELSTGHVMQKSLTGSGCMLSAAICSALAVSNINFANVDNKDMRIITHVCKEMGDSAKRAASYAMDNNLGAYSFRARWFDELM